MRSTGYDAPPGGWVEAPLPPVAALRTILGMVIAEFHRVRHEPVTVLTHTAQPLLWLLVFAAALSNVRGLHDTDLPYQVFVVPGVLGQSILSVSLYSGLSIIWERDLGITQRLLASPGPRGAVIAGKALGAAVRVLVQVVIVLAVVAAIGLPIRWAPPVLVGVLLATVAGGALFSCLSMVIASAVRSREQFMGLGQLIMLPLFFASNALYTIELMPGWLRAAALVNPLTYLVEALRRLLVGVGPDRVLWDLGMLVAATVVLAAVATYAYPRKAL